MTQLGINLSYLLVMGMSLLLLIGIAIAIGLLIYGLFIKKGD